MKTYVIYVRDRKSLINDLKKSQTLKADKVKVIMTHETPMSQNALFGIVDNQKIRNAKIINRFDKPIRFTIKPDDWEFEESEYGHGTYKATIHSFKFRDITYEATPAKLKFENPEDETKFNDACSYITSVSVFDGYAVVKVDATEDGGKPEVNITFDLRDHRRAIVAPIFRINEYLATAKTAPIIDENGRITDATYDDPGESHMEEE